MSTLRQAQRDDSATIQSAWAINNQNFKGDKFSYCFNQPGTFTITGSLLDLITKCKNSIEFYVTARPKPEADFQYAPLKPIENLDEVIFTNTSNGEQQKQWNWFFNDNQGFKVKSENTSYFYQNAGQYPVVMIVKNTWGCSDTVMKVITIEPDFAIYVPNAFTPNQDSRNEIFLPILRSAKHYDLKIYDRWGGKIFETADISQGWDGSYNGEMCKEDVYNWKIVVSTERGEQKVITGHVTLYR